MNAVRPVIASNIVNLRALHAAQMATDWDFPTYTTATERAVNLMTERGLFQEFVTADDAEIATAAREILDLESSGKRPGKRPVQRFLNAVRHEIATQPMPDHEELVFPAKDSLLDVSARVFTDLTPLATTPSKEIDPELLKVFAKTEWSFLVFQVDGHGLSDDYSRMNRELSLKGTTEDVQIAVMAQDAKGRLVNYHVAHSDPEKDGFLSTYENGDGPATPRPKKKMLKKEVMTEFLTDAIRRFPSERVMVSFEGHSGDLRDVLPAIHAALKAVTEKLGKKIDILVFDSCFMAQLEIATEFSDVARYLVASQEGVVKFRSFPNIARFASAGHIEPANLATQIVLNNKEFTFSAIDLEKLDGLNEAIKAMGEVILDIKDKKALKEIRRPMTEVTSYYSEGVFRPNYYFQTIDFKGFVNALVGSAYLKAHHPDLVTAAHTVLEAFGKKGEGVILEERHTDKVDKYLLDYTDVRGSNGLSIHQPSTPKPFRNSYTHVDKSRFNKVTNWDRVTDHVTATRSPLRWMSSAVQFTYGAALSGINALLQLIHEKYLNIRDKYSGRGK
ncbi:MAG: hypothetical protein HQM16_14400 [Deltaproteobacteria bacterium]|nr:hypothetical protein [Deltaproteobacteria bacterium]